MYASQQIRDLRKQGRLKEAYELGCNLLNQYPEDRYVKQAVGWVLYDYVKQIVAQYARREQEGDRAAKQVRSLLREFARLDLGLPDMLYSQLVGQLVKLGTYASFLPGFLKWGGLDAFRDEDYRAQVFGEENKIQPLVWRAGDRAAKISTETEKREETRRFVLSILDRVRDRAEDFDEPLLLHREALLHYKLGEHDKARRAAIASVRAKQNDWWRWRVLAQIEAARDPDACLNCYARAITGCNEMQYAVGALVEAADAALGAREERLARWLCREAVEERKRHEWKIPESLRSRVEADWYREGSVPETPWDDLRERARQAARSLYTSEQFQAATFLGLFQNKAGKEMFRAAVRQEGQSSVRVGLASSMTAGTAEMGTGAPVWVVVEAMQRGERVVHLERRPGGEMGDALEEGYGIVKHQNQQKKITAIYIRESVVVTLRHDEFAESGHWSVGTPVKVLYAQGDKGGWAVHAAITEFSETEDIQCVKDVFLARPAGFGFIGDIFVPPYLAKVLENGTEVEALAIRELNEKRGEIGWRAITADPCRGTQ